MSTWILFHPRLASMIAVAKPAGPPPTTTVDAFKTHAQGGLFFSIKMANEYWRTS
jgi:hypothetical protein